MGSAIAGLLFIGLIMGLGSENLSEDDAASAEPPEDENPQSRPNPIRIQG